VIACCDPGSGLNFSTIKRPNVAIILWNVHGGLAPVVPKFGRFQADPPAQPLLA